MGFLRVVPAVVLISSDSTEFVYVIAVNLVIIMVF